MAVLLIVFAGITVRAQGGDPMPTANEIIRKLDLKPLDGEGGFYRETYRSDINISAREAGVCSDGLRRVSTAIYFLVTPESFSALHRVKSDEIFHFYSGDPVDMVQIDSNGKLATYTLGPDVLNGQTPQILVPRGNWQALKLHSGGSWCLMGTTVAPGFEFSDFELGDRNEMLKLFPHLTTTITDFTAQ